MMVNRKIIKRHECFKYPLLSSSPSLFLSTFITISSSLSDRTDRVRERARAKGVNGEIVPLHTPTYSECAEIMSAYAMVWKPRLG